MRWQHVHLEAVGHVLPDKVVTSDELEDQIASTMQRLGSPRGRLAALTGVREQSGRAHV